MSQAKIEVAVRQPVDKASILDIHGEITGQAEEALVAAYNQASQTGVKTIILNFSELEYMNSSGIGLLVTLLIRIQRQKQRLLAYGLDEHYRQIFELTRLSEAIGLYADEAQALMSVER